MSDLEQAAAPAEVNAGTIIPGEDAPQSQPAPSSDVEVRARAMGWVPQDEFKGPPEKWKAADQFVQVADDNPRVLRERNEALAKRLEDLERKAQEQERSYQANLKAIDRMSTVALQRQREQLVSAYDAAMRDAASSADVARFDQLTRDKAEQVARFDAQVREAVKVEPPAPQQDVPREVQEFVQRNTWFSADQALNMAAQSIHMDLNRSQPGLTLAQNLSETERRVKMMFPEKFGIRPQAAAQYGAVDPGGGRLPAQSGKKGVNELPADAKIQAERFVKQGLYKNVAEYAADYWSQD